MSARAKMERCDKPEYVVPEGTMSAVTTAVVDRSRYQIPPYIQEIALEAAIEWLSKNPIIPTREQAARLRTEYHAEHGIWEEEHFVIWIVNQWQRRMFLKPHKPFDPSLGGVLAGRTFTQEEAKAIKDYIQMSVRGM